MFLLLYRIIGMRVIPTQNDLQNSFRPISFQLVSPPSTIFLLCSPRCWSRHFCQRYQGRTYQKRPLFHLSGGRRKCLQFDHPTSNCLVSGVLHQTSCPNTKMWQGDHVAHSTQCPKWFSKHVVLKAAAPLKFVQNFLTSFMNLFPSHRDYSLCILTPSSIPLLSNSFELFTLYLHLHPLVSLILHHCKDLIISTVNNWSRERPLVLANFALAFYFHFSFIKLDLPRHYW